MSVKEMIAFEDALIKAVNKAMTIEPAELLEFNFHGATKYKACVTHKKLVSNYQILTPDKKFIERWEVSVSSKKECDFCKEPSYDWTGLTYSNFVFITQDHKWRLKRIQKEKALKDAALKSAGKWGQTVHGKTVDHWATETAED